MRLSTCFGQPHRAQLATWRSRAGVAGFAIFLLKGLVWLLTPVLFALWR